MTGQESQFQAGQGLPRYRSHKDVWALKIASIDKKNTAAIADEEPAAIITPVDPGYTPFPVTHAYMVKHDPQPGGYWVLYKDGYQSWSPAEAFEEGYTRV